MSAIIRRIALIVSGLLVLCGIVAAVVLLRRPAELTVTEDPAPIEELAPTEEEPEAEASQEEAAEPTLAEDPFYDPGEGYQLEQVVVLSRHNIRSPLSAAGSTLDMATTHVWFDWTSDPSELSLRGGALETMMGQYFREWLESEGLIEQNWQPSAGEVRFYANSKQRTIATAQYFSSGMLPVGNVHIETHEDYDTMDAVFTPQCTYLSDSYEQAALDQIAERFGKGSMRNVAAGLKDSYQLISEVVDLEGSKGYKSGEIGKLDTTDTGVTLEEYEEPAMAGSLKLACQLSDALVLQYYEQPDDAAAAFGHSLTFEQWRQISQAKDTYNQVLFTAPLVATNVAHPLLAEIGSELDERRRVFTFLCGHDSNLASVAAALQAEDYVLPQSVEQSVPIGAKLVFERWSDEAGERYARVRLVYQNTDQLRGLTLLTPQNPPMSYDLTLHGLQKNDDGLYAYDDVRERIQEATDAYDQLEQDYPQELADAA